MNYSFEDVKNYFLEDHNEFIEILKDGTIVDLKEFIKLAICDLSKISNEEEIVPVLQPNDFKGAELISFKLVYFLVSDQYDEAKEFAGYWACLLKNYLNNFYPELIESIEGLINLLALQNNMARLITLSDYMIFKKQTEYKTVPKDFLEAFLAD